MTIIDNYIEPAKILSYYEGLTISKKEYTFLKQLGQMKRDKILKESNNCTDNQTLYKKAIHIRINPQTYPNLSILNKEIILANAILPNDIELIGLLSKYGFTIFHLKAIIRFRTTIKNLLIHKKPINKELKENIMIYKKVVTILLNIFNEHYQFNDSTIILNRITELLITSPDLFEKITNQNKRTKTIN